MRFYGFVVWLNAIAISLCAAPKEGKIMHGAGILDRQTILQQSDKLIIDWKEFSIHEGEAVRFDQPSKTSAVLNRVIGNEISEIHGLLQGNGKIYLVNQNGIIVGPKGKIEAAAFIGSAFDIANENFIKGIDEDIKAMGGNASALAINLDGIIELKKGSKIDVSSGGNAGTIIISGKHVAVEKNAELLANGLEEGNGGKVILWGEEGMHFLGTAEAKGGEKSGNGGFIEISSPKNWHYDGVVNTFASNGKIGTVLFDPSDITIGDFGGVSNPVFTPPTYNPAVSIATLDAGQVQTALLLSNVSVLTSAGSGGSGTITVNGDVSITWITATTLTLTADRNIVFNSGASITNTAALVSNFTAMNFQANQGTPVTGDFSGISLNNTTLTSSLGNITLIARGGTTTANDGISITSSHIESTGTGMDAAIITLTGTAGASLDDSDGVYIEASSSSIISQDGPINLTGDASSATGSFNVGIHLRDTRVESTGTATITLNGMGGSGLSENEGVQLDQISIITSINGAIDITATSNGTDNFNAGMSILESSTISSTGIGISAATITINSTSGSGTSENHGILMDTGFITSTDGDINITATSNGTGSFNNGIRLLSLSEITSTGAGADAADLTLNATGGGGIEDVFGVHGDSSTRISVNAGDLTITGGFVIDP